jgi:UDP-glucose 4-epimerase
MENVAIIGGAGFIGSHFVDYFMAQETHVTVIDNFSSGSIDKLKSHLNNPRLTVVEGEAGDSLKLQEIFCGIDTVIHLASNPDISKAETDPRVDFLQGTSLTESALEASRVAGVRKFIYASGSGVYGPSAFIPIKENHLLEPISTYGASKLAGESLLSAYSFMFGIKGVSLRFANVIGARQTHGVGYDFIRKLSRDPKKLEILGDGTQTKSYIHVIDVINAAIMAIDGSQKSYDVYNVATQDSLTVREIAEMSIRILGLAECEVFFGKTDRGWKADVPKILLSTEKLRGLGWENKHSSLEAMEIALKDMAEQNG